MSKMNTIRDRPWLNCPSHRAERILLKAFGKHRYEEMKKEYRETPPSFPEDNWIKWLMHLVLNQRTD